VDAVEFEASFELVEVVGMLDMKLSSQAGAKSGDEEF
jgi:hypothetical protein